MPSIKKDKAAFYATWGGKTDKENGDITYKLKVSAQEMAAAMWVWSLAEHDLDVRVVAEDQKIGLGRCVYGGLTSGEEGDSVIRFKTNLVDLKLTPEQQLFFKERNLTIIVKDLSALNENEDDDNDQEND